MKQTIQTKNYTTTIEIPYEKLLSKPNCIFVPTKDYNYSKTVVVPHEHCFNYQSPITLEALYYLYKAFDQDMKNKYLYISMLRGQVYSNKETIQQLQNKIKHLYQKTKYNEQKYTENGNLLSYIYRITKENYILKKENFYLKEENGNKDKEINKIQELLENYRKEKYKVFNVKIMEFSNAQIYMYKKSMEYMIKDKESIEFISKKYVEQLKNYNNSLRNYNNSLKYENNELKNKNERLLEQVSELRNQNQSILAKLNDEINQLRNVKYLYLTNLRNYNRDLLKNVYELKIINSGLSEKLSHLQERYQYLTNILRYKDEDLKSKHQHLQKMYSNLSEKTYSQNQSLESLRLALENSYRNLSDVKYKYDKACEQLKHFYYKISLLNSQLAENEQNNNRKNSELLLEIYQKNKQINYLYNKLEKVSEDFEKKSKVYEVKIYKIIYKEYYIKQLYSENYTIRRNLLDVQKYNYKLKETILERNKDIYRLNYKIRDLENAIDKLKAYIEEKYKSFAWIVERYISKDISLNKNDSLSTYKVYPMYLKKPSEPLSQPSQEVVKSSPQYLIIYRPDIEVLPTNVYNKISEAEKIYLFSHKYNDQ